MCTIGSKPQKLNIWDCHTVSIFLLSVIVVVVPTVFSIIFIAVIMTVILVVICIALRPLFRLRNNLGETPSTIIPTTAAGTHPYAAAQGAPVVLPPTAASNNTQPPPLQQQQGMETSGAHSITRGPTDPQAPPPSYNVAIAYPSYNS